MEKEIDTINHTSDDEKFCFKILSQVSLTFAAVTKMLEEPLRTLVCTLYLILRALDIIEDDMTFAEDSLKLEALKNFSKCLDELSSPKRLDSRLKSNCNQSYIDLMNNFDKVLRVFGKFSNESKIIIKEVVEEMTKGMVKYSIQSIETMAEYNEYCYYAAGTLGLGLTKLFQSNRALDMTQVHHDDLQRLSISVGLFLQKSSILRDISEDFDQPLERVNIPKEIWKKYVENARHLTDENYQSEAIACLNYLINDAFQHLPESIEYLSLLSEKSTFRFIAIPQCAAVGVMVKMFSNPAVFNSVVKLDATEMVYISVYVTDMTSCLNVMKSYLLKLLARIDSSDPSIKTKNWFLQSVSFIDNYENKLDTINLV